MVVARKGCRCPYGHRWRRAFCLPQDLTKGGKVANQDTTRSSMSEDLAEQFEWIISFNVGRFYKKGWRWKPKIKSGMMRLWNDPRFNNGYVKDVREAVGSERATMLYKERIDEIINNPVLLEQARNDWKKDNPLAE